MSIHLTASTNVELKLNSIAGSAYFDLGQIALLVLELLTTKYYFSSADFQCCQMKETRVVQVLLYFSCHLWNWSISLCTSRGLGSTSEMLLKTTIGQVFDILVSTCEIGRFFVRILERFPVLVLVLVVRSISIHHFLSPRFRILLFWFLWMGFFCAYCFFPSGFGFLKEFFWFLSLWLWVRKESVDSRFSLFFY